MTSYTYLCTILNTHILFYFIYFILFYLFCLFAFSRAAPAAYGGSQARGLIGAVAAKPMPEPQQRGVPAASATYTTAQGNVREILNPLSKARDQTHILMDTSRVLNSLNHSGNSPK